MNAFLALAILATFIYSLLFELVIIKLYFGMVFVYYILTQTFSVDKKVNGLRKKLCIATWGAPSEPNAYLSIDVDVTKALDYLHRLNEKTEVKHTMTHLVTRAMGIGLDRFPEINGNLAFGNFYPNKRTDVSVLVNVEGGKDLVNVTVEDVPNKSLEEISQKLNVKTKLAKSGQDQDHKKKTGLIPYIPTFVIEPILYTTGYIAQNLRISMKPFGMKAHEFGTAIITNVGTLGVKDGYAPFPPFAHVPIVVCVGMVDKEPRVIDDQIVIRDIMKINLTIDHRFSDAGAGVKCFKAITNYMEDPEGFENDLLKQKQD